MQSHRLLHACGAGIDVSSGGAGTSRCVPKCGQRDGAQTADVDGELPMFSAGAVSAGGRPAVAAAGVSRHPDGDSAGAPAWQVRSACVNVSSGFADIDDSPEPFAAGTLCNCRSCFPRCGWPPLEATSA